MQFAAVSTRLDKVDSRMDGLKARMGGLEARMRRGLETWQRRFAPGSGERGIAAAQEYTGMLCVDLLAV